MPSNLIDDSTRKRIMDIYNGGAEPTSPDVESFAPIVNPDPELRQRLSGIMQSNTNANLLVGGTNDRMAMFPDEFTDKDNDYPNVFERGARGIAHGFASMVPASMTVAGGIIDFMGADEIGQGLAESGIQLEDWLQEHVAVENPQFFDHLMSGVGSMASFLIPGMGAAGVGAKGAQLLGLAGKSAKVFQVVTQAGTMAFLESAVEQSQRQSELMGQGQSAEEALKNSEGVFWKNMVLLTATNAPLFSPAGRFARKLIKSERLAKAAGAAVSEGVIQERMQAVIQDVAADRGNWSDYLDPGKYQTETLVGAIIGGGAGALLTEGDAKKKDDAVGDEPGAFEGDLPPGFGEVEEPTMGEVSETPEFVDQEPVAVSAPAVEPTRDEQKADKAKRKEEELDALARSGVPEIQIEEAAALVRLERGLAEEFGVDIDLAERLNPEQIKELAQGALRAINEPDNQKSWAMESAVSDKAKDMLFKGRVSTEQKIKDEKEKKKKAFQEEKLGRKATRSAGLAERDAMKGLPPELLPEMLGRPGAEQAPITPEKPQISAPPTTEKQPVVPQPVTEAKQPKIFPPTKQEPKQAPIPAPVEPVSTGSGVQVLPLPAITTDPETFQMRDDGGEFDEDFVKNAVENFDETKVNPITVWRDPKTNTFKVLDGHHTREILRRVGKGSAAVKVFKGTREEAIKFSEEANAARRGINEFDAAKVLRKLREKGAGREELVKRAKVLGDKNWSLFLAVSYLNPGGKTMDALKALQSAPDEKATVQKYARWIGEARRRMPTLSNRHEGEMFDYLNENGGQKGMTRIDHFMNLIQSRGTLGSFEGVETLNLKKLKPTKSPEGQSYEEALKELKEERVEAVKEWRALHSKFKERIAATSDEGARNLLEVSRATAAKKFKDADAVFGKQIKKLQDEWLAFQEGGGGQTSLFGPPATAPKPKAKPTPVQAKPTPVPVKPKPVQPKPKQKPAKDAGVDLDKTPNVIGQTARLKRMDDAQALRAGNPLRSARIVDPKSLAGVKKKQADIITALGKVLGIRTVFYTDSSRTRLRGGFRIIGDKRRVFVSVKNHEAMSPVLTIFGHEFGHYMEEAYPKIWNELKSEIEAQTEKHNIARYGERLPASYKQGDVIREFVSDIIADQFASDSFWKKLSKENPTAFEKIAAAVRGIIDKIKAIIINSETKSVRKSAMGQYIKDMLPIEIAVNKAIAASAAEVRAEIEADAAGISSQSRITETTETSELVIRALDIEDPVAKVNIGERNRVTKGLKMARIRSWSDMPRFIYKKMVDENTLLFGLEKAAIEASSKFKLSTFPAAQRAHNYLQRAGGWTSRAEQSLKVAVLDWKTGKKMGDSLQSIFKSFDLAKYILNGEFGEFMIAARWMAMHEVLQDSLFTGKKEGQKSLDLPDSKEVAASRAEFAEYEAMYNRMVKLHPKWAEAAKEITKYANNLMMRLKQSGMISEDQYSRIVDKYEIYAPLYVLEKEDTKLGKPVYSMDRLIPGQVRMDPIEALIKSTYRLELLNTRNKARMMAADFVIKLSGGKESLANFGRRVVPRTRPLQDYIDEVAEKHGINMETATEQEKSMVEAQAGMYATQEFQKEGVISFMRDGEVEFWQFENDILDVFNNQGSGELAWFMKFFSTQTQLLRAGAILTPEFMGRNQFRDFMSAGVLSQHLVKNPKDAVLLPFRIFKGLMNVIDYTKGKGSEEVEAFINWGGANSSLVALDQEQLRSQSKELVQGKKYHIYLNPIRLLQELSNLTENSTRVAVFTKTRADLLGKDYSLEDASVIAATEARESSTDFGRAGEYGKVINRIIPFFNAGLQGNDKLYRSLFVDKGRRASTWARGVALITIPSMMLWAINHDDDWYKDQPWWVKNHFWLFSVDGGKTILKLPKPFEVGMIFGSLPERMLDYFYDKDPDALNKWATEFRKDMLPANEASIMGPIAGTVNEIRSNYDVYRDTPIVKGWMSEVIAKEQYTANTSEFAKAVGGAFPGKGVSPLMIDHFIRGSFGGLGRWGADIASEIIMQADPKRKAMKPSSRLISGVIPDWTPVVRAFVTTSPVSYGRNIDDFYEMYDNAREATRTLQSLKAGGATKEQFIDLYRTVGVSLAQYEALSRVQQKIGQISKTAMVINRAPASAYSRDEKRKQLDELAEARNEILMKFMEKFKAQDWDEIQKKIDASVADIERQWDNSNRR